MFNPEIVSFNTKLDKSVGLKSFPTRQLIWKNERERERVEAVSQNGGEVERKRKSVSAFPKMFFGEIK